MPEQHLLQINNKLHTKIIQIDIYLYNQPHLIIYYSLSIFKYMLLSDRYQNNLIKLIWDISCKNTDPIFINSMTRIRPLFH